MVETATSPAVCLLKKRTPTSPFRAAPMTGQERE